MSKEFRVLGLLCEDKKGVPQVIHMDIGIPGNPKVTDVLKNKLTSVLRERRHIPTPVGIFIEPIDDPFLLWLWNEELVGLEESDYPCHNMSEDYLRRLGQLEAGANCQEDPASSTTNTQNGDRQ